MGERDPHLFQRLFDDDSVSSGGVPVADALSQHERDRGAPFRAMIGSLVVPAGALDEVAAMTKEDAPGSVAITLRVAEPAAAEAAVAAVADIAAVRLEALDVALPDGVEPGSVVPALTFAGRPARTHVALPYDWRSRSLVKELAGTGLGAKLRVGGRAGQRPSDELVAASLVDIALAGVACKVVGVDRGLADAVARPGYERTGVLNLLVAADAACDGADQDEIVQILRAGDSGLMDAVLFLDPAVREVLQVVGVVDVDGLVDDLVHHGLVPVDHQQVS
ncbi:hypothetical protein [Nocardioides sp. TF02-7]|uniref:hypothetical protein n=1 Tax=Nocardioides sp. TF02-7 TaxID=2917724 RepID=UPI001F053C10|nr:hypothetical protein [Nocardioides sp. TF02-7]UMG91675.1 hypothetical protein MF408_16520 [Nocardioides sp. TF02-7]